MDSNDTDNLVNKIIKSAPISIRVDKKQLISQLRAMHDNYIELLITPNNLRTITLKDSYNINTMRTRN